MSRLEEFLRKSKHVQETISHDLMKFSQNKYQCQSCDEWSDGSFFDPHEMIIYWDCPQGHQSKVKIGV